jgi:hypothetical protein
MKIVLGLPSCNEAHTIENIVRTADYCISTIKGISEGTIASIDHSIDNTQELFHSTPTANPKVSIHSEKGKGSAILAAIKFALEVGADAVIFVDTDLPTVELDWVQLFVNGIKKGYEALFLRREPRWNAGDLTNNLCYPVLTGIWGAKIHEPIGGEFALSRRVLTRIINADLPAHSKLYGVDFFIASQATEMKWGELVSEKSKNNKLRSYRLNPNSHEIIFGNKFYEVFSSVIHWSCERISKRMPPHITHNQIGTARWQYPTVPDDAEMNSLASSTHSFLRDFKHLEALEGALKAQTIEEIYAAATKHISYRGIPWDLWECCLIDVILYSRAHKEISQLAIEAIEQIFLARTVNHYLSFRSSNKWYKAIEDNAESFFRHRVRLWD